MNLSTAFKLCPLTTSKTNPIYQINPNSSPHQFIKFSNAFKEPLWNFISISEADRERHNMLDRNFTTHFLPLLTSANYIFFAQGTTLEIRCFFPVDISSQGQEIGYFEQRLKLGFPGRFANLHCISGFLLIYKMSKKIPNLMFHVCIY